MLLELTFKLFATLHLCAVVSLYVANSVVTKVQSTTFVGGYIDERLCWHEHVNMLYTKLSKSLGLLKVTSVYLPRSILLSMLYAFFNSQQLYVLLIRGNTYSSYLVQINVLYNDIFAYLIVCLCLLILLLQLFGSNSLSLMIYSQIILQYLYLN